MTTGYWIICLIIVAVLITIGFLNDLNSENVEEKSDEEIEDDIYKGL